MKEEKKSAILKMVIGFIGFLALFLISIINELTEMQHILVALVMLLFGILFALGLINLSAINSSRKK